MFVSSSFNTYVNLPKKKNPLYDQFAAELNLQLKPQETDIKIILNLIYGAISPPIHRI